MRAFCASSSAQRSRSARRAARSASKRSSAGSGRLCTASATRLRKDASTSCAHSPAKNACRSSMPVVCKGVYPCSNADVDRSKGHTGSVARACLACLTAATPAVPHFLPPRSLCHMYQHAHALGSQCMWPIYRVMGCRNAQEVERSSGAHLAAPGLALGALRTQSSEDGCLKDQGTRRPGGVPGSAGRCWGCAGRAARTRAPTRRRWARPAARRRAAPRKSRTTPGLPTCVACTK